MNTARVSCWSALVLLLGLFPAYSQFDTATVLGTIRDKTGAVIPGAKVTLISLDTGIQADKTTSEEGSYEFFNVKIGRYKVTAEKAGFSTAAADNVTANIGARQRVDLELAVGQVTETVQVTDAVKLVETDSSQRGQVVSARQIVDLPLNGRQYSSLVLLTTGTRTSTLGTGGTPREGSFNVNGLRSTYNNYLLDGMDNNAYGTSNQGFSNQVMQPSPDAVAEFQVVTNNLSAEYGRSGGATVNVAHSSGGNEFHGAAWNFLRNTQLNAVGFFKPIGVSKPPLNRNQFGFTVGGPILKNRAFFFLDYEGFRQVRKVVSFSTIPSLDDRRGVFNAPVRNPLTADLYPANTPIPATATTTFARRVLNDLPIPTGPGRGSNFQLLQSLRDNTDKYSAKFDYQLSSRWNGFLRIGQRKVNIFDEPGIPPPSGGGGNGYTDVLNQQLATAMTFAASPTQLLEMRLAVSRTRAGKAPIGLGAPTMRDVYGIQGLSTDPRIAGGLTSQLITGFSDLGKQATNPQWQHPAVVNPKVNYSRFLGRHSLKAGYEFQRVHTEIQDVNPLYGNDSYSGQFSRPAGATVGDAATYNLADFLFGLRSRYALTNLLIAQYRQNLQFLYLQDDFKFSSKLTLNLGLRYEYATPQWERDNVLSNFDPAGLRLVPAKSGSIADRALLNPDRNNWAPRVGLAYSLDPRTVIRAGFGTSYIHFNRSGGGNILAINGPQVVTAVVEQRVGEPGFRTTQEGYPAGLVDSSRFNPLRANITYMPPDTRTSYVMSWFLSVQREVAKNLLVDLAYVGNRSNKLLLFADYNQARTLTPAEAALPAAQQPTLQQRRPFQSFADITYAFPGSWSNYNSLQLRVERRLTSGFFLLSSFTYSKALDNGSGALEGPNGNASSPQNVYNLAGDKGPSAYDQTLIYSLSGVYELPFGKGRKYLSSLPAAAEALLGGWKVSGLNQSRSGEAINLFYSAGGAFLVSSIGPDWRGAPRMRPNVAGDPLAPDGQRTYNNYLNPATVAVPTNPSQPFGNVGRNVTRSFPFHQIDFSVNKRFPLVERFTLQFRTEIFNLLNKTNFNPSANGNLANRSNASFGRMTGTYDQRQVQFALRLEF